MPKKVEEQRTVGRPQYFLQHKGKKAVAIAKKKVKRVSAEKDDKNNSNNMQLLHESNKLDMQQQDVPNQAGMTDGPRQHNTFIRPRAGGMEGRPGQFNAPAEAGFYCVAGQAIPFDIRVQMGAQGMGCQPLQINPPGRQGFTTGQRSLEPQSADNGPENARGFPQGRPNVNVPRSNVRPGFGPGLAFNHQNNNWSS